MSLSKGTQLGPYEVLALIGEGGMGQVYRATDKRLSRTVAIKVLPPHFSDNGEMKERFEREAQAIAGLNHSHVCTLHDVGHQDGTDYLVMEFLEGETLAQRLERGALPMDEALKIGIEIADALDRAHREGVVHRDLKPANIMLTKAGSKLLDFGLAKLRPAAVRSSTLSALPTSANVTAQGAILGTLQYMAPEQLEGREADARTDIFAFGALMYEMVTGKKAFEGRSQAGLISSIMSAELQSLAQFQPLTPPALEHVVRMRLRKESEDRWQTAHDLVLQLQWLASGGTQAGLPAPVAAQARKRERVLWISLGVATLLIVALAVPAVLYFRETPSPDVIRFLVSTPNMGNEYFVSISPDGRQIAFAASTGASGTGLFVRQMGSTATQQLSGTDGAMQPFWSPDSRTIGFSANGRLRKIDASGGTPQNICDLVGSGTWNKEGTILISAKNILYRVSAVGGDPSAVTSLNPSNGESGHFWPHFLPDGRHFFKRELSSIAPAAGRPRRGALPGTRRFTWFDRSGKELTSVAETGAYTENFALSPNEKQVAVSIGTNRTDLWVIELATGATSRFTFDSLGSLTGRDVVWSPDGLQLAYTTTSKGNQDISVKKASGVGKEDLLVGSPNSEFVEDWSADGRYIVYGTWAPSPTDLWAIPLAGDRKPFPVVQSPYRKDEPHFSFDGKWLAYGSEESGPWQIYVISFPAADQKRQISAKGGSQPRWRRDGKELYYLAPDGKLIAVDITASAGIGSDVPRVLFDTGLTVEPTPDQYAVTADGQRFLVLKPVAGAAPTPITVVVNWAASLRK